MMRVTGGSLRGRRVDVPVADGVRPTSERAREALFNLVGQGLAGVRFLDAFGGTGMIAIEAASRGATVVVCERDRAALIGLHQRLQALPPLPIEVVAGDVRALAVGLGEFDVVFADPPWAADIGPTLEALAPRCVGTLVLESDDDTALPDLPAPWVVDRVRSYGRVTFHLLVRA